MDGLADPGLLVDLLLGLQKEHPFRGHQGGEQVVDEGLQVVDLGGGEDRELPEGVVKKAGQGGGNGVPLRQGGEEGGVRRVHEEGAGDDGAQQLLPVEEGEGDVAQLRLAGEDIGFAQLLGLAACVGVELGAGFFREDLFVELPAVGRAGPEGAESFAVCVDEPHVEAGAAGKGLQNAVQTFFVDQRINTGCHGSVL